MDKSINDFRKYVNDFWKFIKILMIKVNRAAFVLVWIEYIQLNQRKN